MKKYFIGIILTTLLFVPTWNVSAAQTLNDLIKEAEANRAAYNKVKNQKALTEQEKEEATTQKLKVEQEIKDIDAEIKQAEIDIAELEKSIETKDKEIKNLMKFVQVSNGESVYLEYAFGASSFTDFIYRVSVAEQLSSYNEELIAEYNQNIKDLEQKQKDLAAKQTELNKKQQELVELEAKLTKEIEQLNDGMVSKDTEYKIQIEMINSMKARGCTGSMTFASCFAKVGSSSAGLASTSLTTIPIASGFITSDYGWRKINGRDEFHTGIDFGASKGTTVYPVADGRVVLTKYDSSCGNHMVYVAHNINGHEYVTSYWHMSTFLVTKNQKVTTNTPIGKVAAPASQTGDTCGGGSHVHLNLFDNAGGKWDKSAANGFPNSGRIDPHTALNIPHPQKDGHGGYIPLAVRHG